MRNTKVVLGTALVLVTLTAGCAKPPQVEWDAAKAALTAAENAQAGLYAENELRAAREAGNAVQAEIDAQAGKFALFRSYKTAKQLIADATTKANDAAAAAAAGKQRAMEEANAALEAARTALADASAKIAEVEGCPRKPKGFAADMATMKGNLDGLTAEVTRIEGLVASEDYLGAKSAADALAGQAGTLTADLDAAKTKMGC
jgi:hypothetical protein